MSGPDGGKLSPDQEAARAAIRDLPPARPRMEFRDRLRREFVSGEIESPFGAPRRLRPPTVRWPRLVTAAVAAAFAVMALVWLVGRDRPGEWNVIDPAGTPVRLKIDGASVSIDDPAEIRERLRRGGWVALDDTLAVTLASGDAVYVQLTPGSEVRLPPAPLDWAGWTAEAAVETGEIRVTTGASFTGGMLAIRTPEALVEVRGTTLAIIRESFGTCVCVFEGSVRVGRIGGAPETVPEGMRRTIYRDQRAPLLEEILPMESMKLGMLRDACILREAPPEAMQP